MATIVFRALPCAPLVGRGIGLAAGDSDREIQDAGDRLGRDARAIVGDDDLPVADLDADHRRDAGFLGGVERVVDQFLENDERPLIGAVADLLDQLALGAEIEQAGRSERLALEDARCPSEGVLVAGCSWRASGRGAATALIGAADDCAEVFFCGGDMRKVAPARMGVAERLDQR